MQYSLHDVFISYRRFEDKEKNNDLGTRLAGTVYRFLTKKGLRVFWDDPEMEPGDFEEQLYWQIEHSPNYIFIGTEAAKRFRPDVKDFVAEEVRLALKLYHASPNKDRVVTHVLPKLSKEEQEKAAAAGPYPEEIQGLMNLHGVELHDELPTDKDLSDILKLVTSIKNRGNVWNAGHRWFERSREAGHRFASLNINKSIMPNANIQRQEDVRLPIRAHGDDQADLPLLEMIEKTPGHLYLIGEGGIGKTTALYSIMEDVYGGDLPTGSMEQLRLNGQVPLFVELSRAPDTYGKLYEGGKSTFIHRAVYQQLRQDLSAKQVPGSAVRRLDEVFEIDPETAVNPIHDLFTQQSPAPEYLLLLDGLNEVSRVVIEHKEEPEMKSAVVTMILQEIHQLMTECPNVRVILTSRSKEQTNWGDETTLLYLSGVNDDSVKDYLARAHVSQARIESAMNKEKLRDVLRVPLFLTLYAALDGDKELLTQGEILHLFFHQKKKALYSTRTRIDQVDEDVDKAASAKQFHHLTATMQRFILDFILPEIAWRMEQNDMFHIYRIGDEDEVNLSSIIEHVLTDESDTAVCGRYAEAFEEYLSDSDAAQDTLAIAEDMIERLGSRMRRVVDSILNCAVMTLGILQKNGDEYCFIHHHIRDYFAAVYQINRLKLAVYLQKRKKNELARECLSDWKAAPLHAEVRRFIGEALGEAHNAPVCDDEGNWHYVVPEELCERNLLKRGFDIFRGRFSERDGYSTWNLLQILKDVRVNLSGEDFSRIDMKQCEINGHPISKRALVSLLSGTKLDDQFFLPTGHEGSVMFASYSPDGCRIVTSSLDGTVRVWDAETFQLIGTLNCHEYGVSSASFSPDGRKIVTSPYMRLIKLISFDEKVKVWDAETFQLIGTLNDNGYGVNSVSYSPDGRKIVTASEDKTAKVWDAETLQLLGTLKGHEEGINSALYCPDGRRIVTSSMDKTAKVWDAETLQLLGVLKGHEGGINSALYSPDGHRIVTSSMDKTAKVWDAETLQVICTLKGHEGGINSALYSPDGRRIVTASMDKAVKIWDAESLQQIGTLCGHEGNVNYATYSPDGRKIVTASGDKTARVWDAEAMQLRGTLKGHEDGINCASYSPDGRRIVTASEDKTAKVWDVRTCRLIGILRGHKRSIKFTSYSPDGRRIVTTSKDKTAKIWDAESLRQIGTLSGHKRYVNYASFSPDGRRIITASGDKTAKVWDMKTLQLIGTIIGHENSVTYASYSPEGRWIVTKSYRGRETVKIWDAETMQFVGALNEQEENVNSAVYSPDGNKIVTSSDDRTAKVWDAKSLKLIGTLKGHGDGINSASYSPDGNRIITVSEDRTAKVWDADTLQLIGTLSEHEHRIHSASYSPDGNWIVAALDDCTEKVWDAKTLQPIGTLSRHEIDNRTVIYSPDGRRIVTISNEGTTRIWDVETLKCIRTIHNITGLEVIGVDLRHLHPDSRLSDEVKERLYEYGAIVDERG